MTSRRETGAGGGGARIQGYLAHKKQLPPRAERGTSRRGTGAAGGGARPCSCCQCCGCGSCGGWVISYERGTPVQPVPAGGRCFLMSEVTLYKRAPPRTVPAPGESSLLIRIHFIIAMIGASGPCPTHRASPHTGSHRPPSEPSTLNSQLSTPYYSQA